MSEYEKSKEQTPKISSIMRSPAFSGTSIINKNSINITRQPATTTVVQITNPAEPKHQIANNNNFIARDNPSKSLHKNANNRHTIAIPANENYENLYTVTKMSEETTRNVSSSRAIPNAPALKSQNSFDNNPSPLSKTPDSNNENWLTLSDIAMGKSRDPSANRNSGGMEAESSDHELLESSATGLSGSGSNGVEGDESADDDLDSTNASLSGTGGFVSSEDPDDSTTKRLKTFVATTLHNEHIYLDKLTRLLNFKAYLEQNFNGSQADMNVLFSGIQQVYTTHDIVASKLQEYLSSLSDLLSIGSSSSPSTHSKTTKQHSSSPSSFMKETFLSSALQLLANIMEISFPVYLEFLKNYSKSMTILNKLEKESTATTSARSTNSRKTFMECQLEYDKMLRGESSVSKEKRGFLSKLGKLYSQNNTSSSSSSSTKDPYSIYYNDAKKSEDAFDLTRIFAEEILRRPTKLFEFIYSLKEECILASNELPDNYSHSLQSNIKSLFENESSKSLREKVFDEINRNIMPKEVRKNEDVVELIESTSERKIRHLVLYGDCLVCCRIKKDKRQLKWYIPIDHLEIFLDEYKSAKSDTELRHLREEVVSLRKRQTDESASSRHQQKIKKKLAEQENELTIQSSRLKLIVRSNPHSSSTSGNNLMPTSGFFANNAAIAAISNSMTNLANLSGKSQGTSNSAALSTHHHHHHNHNQNVHHHSLGSQTNNSGGGGGGGGSGGLASSFNTFLFTSDFERIAWLEEINGAIYACRFTF